MNVDMAVFLRHRLTIRQSSWLVLGLLALAIVLMPLPQDTAVSVNRTLYLEANSFAFNPAVIEVNPGDEVTIKLTSMDVVHGLYLDGYDLQMTADPGQTAALTFTANKTGTFRFRCSVTCGPLHPFMIGKLKVGTNTLFWRGIILSILVVLLGLWRLRQ